MPGFIVKGPDGKEWDVDVPEGASEQDAIAYVQAEHYEAPMASPDRTTAEDIMRGVGLGARSVVQAVPSAVMGLPALAADAYGGAVDLTRRGVNAAFGSNIPLPEPMKYSRAAADVGRITADAFGLPIPETETEKGLTNIATAAGSALGGAGLANRIARVTSDAAAIPAMANTTREIALRSLYKVMGGMAEKPALQTAGAIGGATATDLARNANLTPEQMVGVGLVGSIIPGSAASLAQRGSNFARAVVTPLTNPGREVVAGMTLNRMATTPTASAVRMAAAQEIIPGSQPTMAQVSQDAGLIGAERVIGQTLDPKNTLGQRLSDQNVARQNSLNRMIMNEQGPGTPQRGSLEYATQKRDLTIEQNMNPAFAGFTPGADVRPVFKAITDIRSNPRLGPRKDVQDAMGFVESRLTQKNVDVTNPESLYAVRSDIKDAIAGKYDTDGSSLRLAQGQLLDVQRSVDKAIEAAAPGYARYMDLYAKRSKPLNQQETLRTLRGTSMDAATDPLSGVRMISQPKFQRGFEKALASGALADLKGKPYEKIIDNLSDIAADLDRGAAINSRIARSPGSDSLRNMSVAQLIGRSIGKNFPDTTMGRGLQTIARPLNFLYGSSDEAIQNLILEAAKDPKLASRFMSQATKYEVDFIANELLQRAEAQAKTQAIYGNQNQQR
tara:strand:- start:30 stop:2042 length:2013 start_codon:yes stop_codon:yes gene_type:complete